jgi:hypothetical protein
VTPMSSAAMVVSPFSLFSSVSLKGELQKWKDFEKHSAIDSDENSAIYSGDLHKRPYSLLDDINRGTQTIGFKTDDIG